MVKRHLPASVYRCKGIVHTTEHPGLRHALPVVGRRTRLDRIGDWGERSPVTEIVAIGRGMDADELTALFDGCLTDAT